MKVYLGPYPNWWNVARFQNWYLKKLHGTEYGWEVDEKDYTRLDKVVDKALDGWQFVLNNTVNKFGQKRKEKIVIHNYDTWSMDNTLALIILPMLKQLKEDKHGAPLVDDKDVPKELRSTSAPKKKNEWDTDDNHFKRWDWVINEMIWAFEQKVDPDEGRSNYYDPYKPNEKITYVYTVEHKTKEEEENYKEFYRNMGKFNRTKYKKYMERKQKAFMLFGKYFEALWD
jgi:hypothetical protein